MIFCPNCNSENEDVAKFCLHCGKPLVLLPSVLPAQPEKKSFSFKKVFSAISSFFVKVGNQIKTVIKKPKKSWIIACIAAIVFLIVLFSSLSYAGSYKRTLNRYTKLLNHYCDDYTEYLPIFLPKDYCVLAEDGYELLGDIDDTITDNIDDILEDSFDDYFSDLEDEYGSYHITTKVMSATRMDKSDLKEIRGNIKDFCAEVQKYNVDKKSIKELLTKIGLDSSHSREVYKYYKQFMAVTEDLRVTDGYILKLRIKVKGSDDSDKDIVKKVEMIKVNGSWILSPVSVFEKFPSYANPFEYFEEYMPKNVYELTANVKPETKKLSDLAFFQKEEERDPAPQEEEDPLPAMDFLPASISSISKEKGMLNLALHD